LSFKGHCEFITTHATTDATTLQAISVLAVAPLSSDPVNTTTSTKITTELTTITVDAATPAIATFKTTTIPAISNVTKANSKVKSTKPTTRKKSNNKSTTTLDDKLNKRAVTKASKPFECPRDGYFPDPDVCSKYFLCAGHSVTQHDCGDGLVWDAELQLCGWSNAIECRNGNRPWEKITDVNGSWSPALFFYLLFFSNTGKENFWILGLI
jgi:hypothetical protein